VVRPTGGRAVSKPDYYSLGKTLAEWRSRPAGKSFEQEIQWLTKRFQMSRGHLYRIIGYYTLFCEQLGYGPEVFQLGPAKLDQVRKVIDWNWQDRKIGSGSKSKLNASQARKLINELLAE
jgi:hypothetical protein